MSSESERKLSLEELKQLNQPKTMPPQSTPMPPEHLTQREWAELVARMKHLEAGVSAQEALLRALGRRVGQATHPGPAGGAGAGCGPNEGGTATGWEKERAALLSAQAAPAVYPLEQSAGGTDGPAPDWGHAVGGLVQLGKALEHDAGADYVRDATTTHRHSDRKALRKEREKKIAMGHKPDDHEENQTWEQAMR